jgi:hypothetical protein
VKVEVQEERIVITDTPGIPLVIPRSYLYEFIECLINAPDDDQTICFYQSYGIAFSKRWCRLIRSPQNSPTTYAEIKRSSIPTFVKGLYQYADDTYFGNEEREFITSYLKKSKVI